MSIPGFVRRAVGRARAWCGRQFKRSAHGTSDGQTDGRADGQPDGQPGGQPPVPVVPSSVPTILLAMVNRERGMRGVGRCNHDVRLTTAAEGHCDAMSDAARCDHAVSGEPCLEDRVLVAGYAFDLLREAVAAGQGTALEVVRDWLADADSRAALLDHKCQHAGFGLAISPTGRHYWTAILAAPQSAGEPPNSLSSIRLAPPVVRGE